MSIPSTFLGPVPGESMFPTQLSRNNILKIMLGSLLNKISRYQSQCLNNVMFIVTELYLQVSEELAQKLGREDADRLLKDRKLVLLVDLDQTLVHTTNDNVPPNLKASIISIIQIINGFD